MEKLADIRMFENLLNGVPANASDAVLPDGLNEVVSEDEYRQIMRRFVADAVRDDEAAQYQDFMQQQWDYAAPMRKQHGLIPDRPGYWLPDAKSTAPISKPLSPEAQRKKTAFETQYPNRAKSIIREYLSESRRNGPRYFS